MWGACLSSGVRLPRWSCSPIYMPRNQHCVSNSMFLCYVKYQGNCTHLFQTHDTQIQFQPKCTVIHSGQLRCLLMSVLLYYFLFTSTTYIAYCNRVVSWFLINTRLSWKRSIVYPVKTRLSSQWLVLVMWTWHKCKMFAWIAKWMMKSPSRQNMRLSNRGCIAKVI